MKQLRCVVAAGCPEGAHWPGDQDEDRQDDLKAKQITIRLVIGLLSRKTVGSRQTDKLETHLLVGLDARLEKLS